MKTIKAHDFEQAYQYEQAKKQVRKAAKQQRGQRNVKKNIIWEV